jgi:hypothetical protein
MAENELVANADFAYKAKSEENGFWRAHVQE